LLLGVLLLLAASLLPPVRVAGKTLLLLPDMFPTSPLRPLTWVTPAPRVEEYGYDFPGGRVDSDIYLPAGSGRHGALILLLGAVGYPRRDPTLVRFADGLARAGTVVMVPESSNLQNGDLLPEEVEGLLRAVDHLRERPEVDAERVGFLGFSVGGSMALLAAQQGRGVETVAFVNAFGAYYDARDLLQAVATEQILVDGTAQPWQPAELTRWVFTRQLILPLPDEQDREILSRAFLDQQPEEPEGFGPLSAAGRTVAHLLRHPAPDQASALIEALPPEIQLRLDGISPSRGLQRTRARIYLMHDRSDSYIPFVESRKIAAQAPAGAVRAHTEFDLFAHVMPDRPLPGPHFAVEVFKLYRHAWQFYQEFL
jgi:acetyl esterase/lipase